uniref:Uncharacterized protein n=1 Tax=Knipowitschia caucasica TaxID=637954 RepID=A0AAV2JQJ0_KNICA
MHGRLCLVQE